MVLEIRKKLTGEYDINYANTLNNLGLTLENLGEFEKAKEGYLKVLDTYKKHYGDNHTEYARTLFNLSRTLNNIG
jgi:tetratricopeptide (TPR) repeat protein